ncbi:MAG: response regulator [Burkholderiales bacterium]|nr:response regulator [Burkholderiales bacterium]MDE2457217.1 response regulator [Burkholderiales bacterium]
MIQPHRVALLGFSDFERGALASCFRLAAQRVPPFVQVEAAAEADFLIVDSDRAEAVRAALELGREPVSVFIGAHPPDAALAWMARPIDPLHVLRELDSMVTMRGALAPRIERPTAPPPPVPKAKPEPAPAPPPALALLVDDSEIALRFLETRLQPLGMATERANSSARAIEMLAMRRFDFVFVDVELGTASDMDGLALCQHIKRQRPARAPGRTPVVVMVSAHHSELDRVRGTLAGADAYFGKPADATALEHLLLRHGVKPPTPGATA